MAKARKPAQATHRFEIAGDMDRHAVEALYLDIRRLATRHGIDVAAFRVEKLSEALSIDTTVTSQSPTRRGKRS